MADEYFSGADTDEGFNQFWHEGFNAWLQSPEAQEVLGSPGDPSKAQGGAYKYLVDEFNKRYGQQVRKDYGGKLKGREEETRQADVRKYLDDFYQEMLKPFDPNDPKYSRIMSTVGTQAQTQAYESGFGGGLNEASVARQVADAALGIQSQREQAGLQALGMSLGDVNQARDVRRQSEQQAADRAFADQQARYQHGAKQSQMWGSVLGGLAGGVGGFALAGPAGLGPGAQMGAGLGGGLAGGAYGPPPSYGGGGGRWRGGGN